VKEKERREMWRGGRERGTKKAVVGPKIEDGQTKNFLTAVTQQLATYDHVSSGI